MCATIDGFEIVLKRERVLVTLAIGDELSLCFRKSNIHGMRKWPTRDGEKEGQAVPTCASCFFP
jgi:hypothetical protein